MAELLGVGPGDIVLTSGGTEADDLAVQGGWEAVLATDPATDPGAGAGPPVVLCAAMEHHAVLEACAALARRTGAELRHIASDADGRVDLDALADACDPGVRLVSVMTVNNELGTIQPIDAVAEVVARRSPGAVFHTDAVQAAPWYDVAQLGAGADLVSVSAHKFGGPQGVGALAFRRPVELEPLLYGGPQERERRAGTHNVAGIVGMAAALEVTARQRDAAWAACHASFEPTAPPEASVAALAQGCAQATGMKPWGDAIVDESLGREPASYPLRTKRGHCYRVFAQGDRGVKDLDVAIVDATGKVAAEDSTDSPTVVLVADGELCFDVDEAATVAVRVEAGKGKYAIQIWSDE